MNRRNFIKVSALAGLCLPARFARAQFPYDLIKPSTSAVPDITNGLIGWWKCNEGPGATSIADSSGNGYTGSFSGSPTWTTGPTGGNALAFNGTSAYVDCGIITQLYGVANATLSAWMYRATTSDSAGFGQTCGFTNCFYRVSCAWTSGGIFYQSVENPSSSFPNFTQNVTGWHHYALTFDGSLSGLSRIVAYFDAVSQTLTAGGGNPPSATATSPNAGHWLLAHDISSGSYNGGALTDVRLYNRVLSSSEITTLFNNGAK